MRFVPLKDTELICTHCGNTRESGHKCQLAPMHIQNPPDADIRDMRIWQDQIRDNVKYNESEPHNFEGARWLGSYVRSKIK